MANPRQNRKVRSGSSRNSLSKASRKNQKKVTVKGPKAIVEAWDRSKTVKQNYEALGLSATPNVTTANKKAHANAVFNQDNTASTSLLPPPIPDDLPEGTIPKGYARIERDADGNIVNVTFADEDAESSAENVERESTPWGKPLPDLDSFNDQAESTRDGARAPTKVVQELESQAASAGPSKKRFASTIEAAWLKDMVIVHGDDVNAIARDKKNIWQRTPGQISQSIKRAGGSAALLGS